MSFFGKLGKGLLTVAKVAAPVVIATSKPETILNTVAGAVIKHGTPINNQSIPYLNLGVSSFIAYVRHVQASGDWAGSIIPALHEGGVLAGLSTALHQSIKVPTQGFIQFHGKSL
jgi:hypothetical protein